MKDITWGKTILSIYRYLDRICGTIDKIVEAKAVCGGDISGQNLSFNNIFNLSNFLLELTERKINLINMKLLTERALAEMEEKPARILIRKYFDGATCYEISKDLNVCLRQYFRMVKLGESSFTSKLYLLGYDNEKLKGMLLKEPWIMEIHESIKNNKEDDININETSIKKYYSGMNYNSFIDHQFHNNHFYEGV